MEDRVEGVRGDDRGEDGGEVAGGEVVGGEDGVRESAATDKEGRTEARESEGRIGNG